ncbi:ribonuclease Z [Candidatus Magnetomoraceae bacterium gMMP-15]
MRPSFHPRLINKPYDDPGVFVPFSFEKRAIIFDLGDIYSLSSGDILKITHAFVSHTHMDHFAGFDRLLRIVLGRQKTLYLFGPPDFLKNVEGKLAAYTWNLVDNYPDSLVLNVTEVHEDRLLSKAYLCEDGFLPGHFKEEKNFNGILWEEQGFTVQTACLDHKIPCLGFRLEEKFHVNIIKNQLDALKLPTGSWIARFKQALYSKADPDSLFDIDGKRVFQLGELTDKIALITPGQIIAYVTDVIYSQSNKKKIIELAKGADQFFIEAAFLHNEKDQASNKYHLTARQAGSLARKAKVKTFTVFHFSPRYSHQFDYIEKEAKNAF